MRGKFDKSIFIEALKENPLILVAAKKAGISRATIYRWIRDNREFREAVANSQKEGRRHFCDVAEYGLMKKVNDGDMVAIKFYLQHNDARYLPMRTVFVEPPTQLKPGETCGNCGHAVSTPMSLEEMERRMAEYIETKKELKELGEGNWPPPGYKSFLGQNGKQV